VKVCLSARTDLAGGYSSTTATGATIPIPRSRYEANGYKPDFDKLPSEAAEYWAAEKKKEDDARS
jgi:hypothetical protein